MAPAKTPQNFRARKPNNEKHLEDVGNVGRATGKAFPQYERDEEDFESPSAYFKSTGKPTAKKRMILEDVADMFSEEEDMQLSSGPDVTETLQQRSVKSTPKLPPHAKSPSKTGLRGSAKRPSSTGLPSSARTSYTGGPTPSHRRESIPKLDLHPGKSPRVPYTPSFRGQQSDPASEDNVPSPEVSRRSRAETRREESVDDTMAPLDDYNGAYEDDEEPEPELDFENDTLKGMQPNTNLEDSLVADQIPSSARRRTRNSGGKTRKSDTPVTAQEPEPVEDELPEEPQHDHMFSIPPDDEEPQQESVGNQGKKRKGRPPKVPAVANSKRVRKNPANEEQPAATGKTAKTAVLSHKDGNAKPKQDGEFKRPGAPASNVRARHETPFDDSEDALYTRSGRKSYKPLAYWKNERVIMDPTATADGAVVHSIRDIIRMEDVTPKKRVVHRADDPPPQRRRRRKARTVFEDDPEDHEEPWEIHEGVYNGDVRVWDPFSESSVDETQDQELAFAASSIETHDNAEHSFRFGKILTMPFFGSGIVEIPPGGKKHTKNSRRMQMTFFVHYGKVTVGVNETYFTISKGGVWQVPRGNGYSIENETEHTAKIFFAQGCEVQPERLKLDASNQDPALTEQTQESNEG